MCIENKNVLGTTSMNNAFFLLTVKLEKYEGKFYFSL